MLSIPWDRFSEDEIRKILSLFYETQDIKVYDVHSADRSHEEGADLILNDDTAIAIKIKPKKGDCYQLIELSKRKEEHKIYIYIQDPAVSFKNAMGAWGENVEFWDNKKLTNTFFEKNPYFAANIIFENSNCFQTLLRIRNLFFDLWSENFNKKNVYNKKTKIENKSLSTLWRLKDMAVTLHKTSKLLNSMFKGNFTESNMNLNKELIEAYLQFLDALNKHIVLFPSYFSEFYERNKEYVDYIAYNTSDRSNWLYIAWFKPLVHGMVKEKLEEEIESTKKHKKSLKEFPDKEFEKNRSKKNDVWSAIESQTHLIHIFGCAVEATIDDIFYSIIE